MGGKPSRDRSKNHAFKKPAPRPSPIANDEHYQDETASNASNKREKSAYSSKSTEYWEQQRLEAHHHLKIDTVLDCNIAFCGKVGSGKSSMINALRHVKKGEPDWAPVSSFQSTTDVKPYRFADPSFKHLVLWDMPGCSTGDVPTDSYYFEQKLFAFDFLVIVSDGFPGTAECALAREARRFGVPFAFVQSKCDKELRSLVEENGEESVSEKVKKKFFDEQKLNFTTIVRGDIKGAVHFLVSSPVLLNLEKNYEYMLDEDEFKNYVLEVVAARRGLHESTGEHRAKPNISEGTERIKSTAMAAFRNSSEAGMPRDDQRNKPATLQAYYSQPSLSKEQQRSAAQLKLNIDPGHSFNIGFCGEKKAGKSRLINALRDIQNDHPDAAPVAAFEATTPMTPYRATPGKFNGAVLWEVPGFKSADNQNYFDDNNLCAMDLLVIMCESHFDKREAQVARNASKYDLPVVFVCSKSDSKLKAESKGAIATNAEKSRFLEKQESSFKANMPSDQQNIPRFWISATVIAKDPKFASFALDDEKFVKYVTKTLKAKFDRQHEETHMKL